MPRYLPVISCCRALVIAPVVMLALAAPGFSQETSPVKEDKPSTFERVFGISGTLDAAMVEKVKALPMGERLAVDRNQDGKNDELWFIDNSPRHSAARRPILVCVIDEDGDLDATGPDLDSDLYLADWQADGVIDSVVDYQDEDHDGDLDAMGIFFGQYQQPWLDKNRVTVWWSRDLGDDNLLWYDVDWSYEQASCQYRSHFSGDEIFYQFALEKEKTHWLNLFEDPFAFYDPDQDGCSEVAVRLCVVGEEVQSLRYSIDIDNDAHGRHLHDYDFSITALAEKGKLQVGIEMAKSFELRGISVHPVLDWQDTRQFAREAAWSKACLTWDEMNANTELEVDRDPHERWEGVINHGSENFEQVGGPPSSPLNKRTEISQKPAKPLRLYYDSTDRRLHLLGASTGWIDVDADLDGIVDARYTYVDSNADGVFDRRDADLDADGKVDFQWKMQGRDVQKFDLEFEPLNKFYQSMLQQTLADSQAFIDAAKSVLDPEDWSSDPVETFFVSKLASWKPATQLGARMRKTPAGARFYLDLIRDRLFWTLKKKFATNEKWNKVEGAYQAGEYGAAATNLAGLGVASTGIKTAAFRTYRKRIPILLDNRGLPERDAFPVTLAVSELRKLAPEFDPNRFALVAPQRWIDWRQVVHQLDELDEVTGAEISFFAELPADSSATYYLYYAPAQDESVEFAVDSGEAEDRLSRISGESPASGRLTLYQDGKPWPVRGQAVGADVAIAKRTVAQGPIRSVVEIEASKLLPDRPGLSVKMLLLSYSGHRETEIRVSIALAEDLAEDDSEVVSLTLAPGIGKLLREQDSSDPQAGYYGSWGWQEGVNGEIGLGLIVAPELVEEVYEGQGERQVRCRLSAVGGLRYWLLSDRRLELQYPIAPTATNWQKKLSELSKHLLSPAAVSLGEPESWD